MNTDSTLIMIFTVAILPIVGVMMALTPYLMKKGECFAVTVPTAAADDPYLKRLRRTYLVIMLAATVVLTVVALVFVVLNNVTGVIVAMAGGSLLICVGSYALMLHFRKKTNAYKKEQGWEAVLQEAVAVVAESNVPHAVSLKWNLLYLPVIALTVLIGIVGYAQMPEQIPIQVNVDGVVSNWVEKTPLVVLMPAAIQGFLAVCFVFSHWTITKSKKLSEPGAPVTSALAYGMFARAQSIYLVAAGVVISIAMMAMPLSFMNAITIMQSAVLVMIAALVTVIGALAIGVIYGQGGARMFMRMQGSETLLADQDEYWKLGVFYFNPDDPSLFLPERFGIGWACNWARPAVWAIMVAGLVVTIGFVVIIMMLF